MKALSRHAIAVALFAVAAAAVAACALSEDSSAPTTQPATSEPAAVQPAAPPAVAGAATALTAPALTGVVGSHPITPEEMQEVRSDPGYAGATGILGEYGESIRLDGGVTAVYEDDARSVDITFTPRDAAGRASTLNLELVYQRISGQRPRFYFVTNESGAPSVTGAAQGPTTQLCIGTWTSWVTTGHYCGSSWWCSKKKWDHLAWFRIEFRSRNCLGGGYQTQVRDVREHCGC